MLIRHMTSADLDQVLAVQQRCYPTTYHEPRSAFENKLKQSPGSSWLAISDEVAHAYLVALPVDEEHFPALHASDWAPPAHPKWLYLHDLAVDPARRGSRAGQGLVGVAFEHTKAAGLDGLVLIAVQGSQPYWQRQGFEAKPTEHAGLSKKVLSFGDEACFMALIR